MAHSKKFLILSFGFLLSAALPASAADVSGRAAFEGTPPAPKLSGVKSFSECAVHHKGNVYTEDALIKDGGLQNVFVYVKEGLEGQKFDAPKEPAFLDQVGCIYKPHVLGVQTGQELVIKNSDVSLHNVHSHSTKQKGFNTGMPVQGMKLKKKFDVPEVMIKLTCDVHPWMKSYIGVVPHPYYAVSDETGAFTLKNLPPGHYVIEAWHETFGTQTQTLNVSEGQTPSLTFVFTS